MAGPRLLVCDLASAELADLGALAVPEAARTAVTRDAGNLVIAKP